MQWLNKIVDEVVAKRPEGEVIVESGISPSGNYHMGYLREILTCDAIVLELKKRGRQARHIHFVDDQDGFRKVPAGLPPEYDKYLGRPLSDMPAPDGSNQSYADYLLKPFLKSVEVLGVAMDVIRSHEKYREGFFVPAIELVLSHISETRAVLEEISGRKLDDQYSPIQVNEEGYLKKRPFVGIDTNSKTVRYKDKDGKEQTTKYDSGQIKLDWRLDWPARWWLLRVNVEPSGRDHSTKGGSYDTGKGLMDRIFKAPAPLPVPYEFINRSGESRKMSASLGTGIEISEVVAVLPPEIARYFVLKSPPSRTLFFDPVHISQLIDEFAQLLAKEDKTNDEKQLFALSTNGIESIISNIPFSHLVDGYQSALKDPNQTLEILSRTEYKDKVERQKEVILAELKFIDRWLEKWAPEDAKFELLKKLPQNLTELEMAFLNKLGEKVAQASADADGEWFHKVVYELKDAAGLEPKQVFEVIYKVTIGKTSGPRAGWFLSILPRDWLIKRLRLEH